jgi:hypothetical protein
MGPSNRRSGPRTWLWLLLLAVAVVTVYHRALGHQFLNWDDTAQIHQNPHLQHPGMFWTRPFQGIYMPLTYSAWSLLSLTVGLQPAPFHLLNLLFHLGSTWLVLLLLRELLGPGHGDRAQRQLMVGTGAGAFLFALHPLQVEPVVWITSLKDTGSGCLALLAMLCYLRFTRSQDRLARRNWYTSGLLAFCGAMLFQPAAVSALLMLAVLGWLAVRRPWRRLALELSPWAAVAVPPLLVNLLSQSGLKMFYSTPLHLRPLLALDSLGFYLSKLVLPVDLVPAYGRSARLVVQSGQIYTGWIPAAAVLALAIVLRRRLPALLLGLLLMISGILLVSGLRCFAAQDNTTVHDRYMYLAMLGPAYTLAWLLARARPGQFRIGMVLSLVALHALGFRSAAQVRHWKTDATLWAYTLQKRPHSPVALLNMGLERSRAGDDKQALELYQRAARLSPHDPEVRNNLGAQYARQGDYAAAETELRAALAIDPESAAAHHNLGKLHLKRKEWCPAIAHLTRALRIAPRHREASIDLGAALLGLGDHEACIDHERRVTTERSDPEK